MNQTNIISFFIGLAAGMVITVYLKRSQRIFPNAKQAIAKNKVKLIVSSFLLIILLSAICLIFPINDDIIYFLLTGSTYGFVCILGTIKSQA